MNKGTKLPTRLAKLLNDILTDPSSSLNSQVKLAKHLGIHQTSLSRLLKGKIRSVSPKVLEKMAKILKMDLKVLAEGLDVTESAENPGERITDFIPEYLHMISDDLPYHMYIKDTSRQIIWANKAMVRSCNCSSIQELQGRRDEDLFDDPHLEEARADDERAINRGESTIDKLEFETWKPPVDIDGKTRSSLRKLKLVVTTKKPIFKMGRILGLIGFTQDYAVTLPSFLKAQGNPWDLSALSDGIYYHNFKTNRTWSDEKFAALFPGTTFRSRWKNVHPDDKRRVVSFLTYLKRTPLDKVDSTLAATIDFRANITGRMQWIRGTGIGFGPEDQRTVICGHQNISAELAAESNASKALLSLPNNVFVFVEDYQGRICYGNKAFLNFLNTSLSKVIGQSFEDLGIKRTVSLVSNKSLNKVESQMYLPVIDYEEFAADDKKMLKLMTIRIPINSHDFDPFCAVGQQEYHSEQRQHVLGLSWDISKHDDLLLNHWSKAAWASLLDSSKDSVYIKTSKGVYQYVNDCFANSVNKKKQAIIGTTASEVFSNDPELVKVIAKEDELLIHQNVGHTQAFRKRLEPNGTPRFESSSKIAIANGNGQVEYILGISRNISAQIEKLEEID